MNNAISNNINTDRLKELLAAVGSQAAADKDQLQVTEHNWHQPAYFNTEQSSRLNDFADNLTHIINENLTHFFGNDCTTNVTSVGIHFAGELAEQTRTSSAYYLPFGSDAQKYLGSLCISIAAALTLVSFLLGDTEPQIDTNKKFSQLEESLLFDIAHAMVVSLCASVKDHFKLQPADAITSDSPVELSGVTEICKISFEVKIAKAPASSQAYFILPCAIFAPLVGKTIQTQSAIPQQELSKIIIGHIQDIPVPISARLVSTVLTFKEIAGLAPNDIIVLNKSVDEPIELLINGQTAFFGLLAQSEGKQAVIITEPPSLPADNTLKNRKAA